jgi:hypothetical protein
MVGRTDHREALGDPVRRYTNSGGQATRPQNKQLPSADRLRRSAMRLAMTTLPTSLKD